jgi:hypothetical protein
MASPTGCIQTAGEARDDSANRSFAARGCAAAASNDHSQHIGRAPLVAALRRAGKWLGVRIRNKNGTGRDVALDAACVVVVLAFGFALAIEVVAAALAWVGGAA